MKRTILIITLIFTLIAQTAYAVKPATKAAKAKPAGKKIKTDDKAINTMSTASIPDANPGDGVSGSMSPFLSESFQTDLATGAGTASIAITIPPGRKNMQPKLGLSYSSNNSNGICGVGWAIPANFIQRSTKSGVPNYTSEDSFMFISSGSNAELVSIGENQYRAKIESGFMKYVFVGNIWTVYDKSGTKYIFGEAAESRQEDSGKTFSWYLNRVEDVYGNYITYTYDIPVGSGQIYLTEINYTGGNGLLPDKKVVFNYDPRTDKLYSYRSGWKITTSQRLKSIEVRLNEALVWQYGLAYMPSPDTGRSLLETITVKDGAGKSLPPKTFTYQTLE